jgi:hypothetical protein
METYVYASRRKEHFSNDTRAISRAPNGIRFTCAAKRMYNCKQPKHITESVTTPMPQTRRQVQALVRRRLATF